ncbi:MAG: PA2779 family protein [Thermoanaerobaculia bacterium]
MKRNGLMMAVMAMALLLAAAPAFAGPVPSKTADGQTLAARDMDLAKVSSVLEISGVAAALEAQGFTAEEVESRLAALSNEDLRNLADNIDQIQAAGLTQDQWMWIGAGALAVLLLVLIL